MKEKLKSNREDDLEDNDGDEGEDDSDLQTNNVKDKDENTNHTVEWLNMLTAEIYKIYKLKITEQRLEDLLNKSINNSLIGNININEVKFGNEFPKFSNCRNQQKKLYLDFNFNDKVIVKLTTTLMINYPRTSFGCLPIDLTLNLVRFSGTIVVRIVKNEVIVNLLSNYNLIIKCQSLIGSKAKLNDIPKIEEIILKKFEQLLTYKFNKFTFKLPKT